MTNPTNQTADPLAELRALLAGYAGWEAWTGVSGIIYARRRMTSPPAVFRGATAEAVAEQAVAWEKAHT